MLKKETKRKLSKLAQFLDKKVKAKDFDYSSFVQNYKGDTPGCGTIGCAAGWANFLFKLDCYKEHINGYEFDCEPLQEFLRLTSGQFFYLFENKGDKKYYEYVTKTEIIKRIREFVKSDGEVKY